MNRPRISCPPCVLLWGAMGAAIAFSSVMHSCSKAPPEGQYVKENAPASGSSDAAGQAPAAPADASAADSAKASMDRARQMTLPTLDAAGLRIPIAPEWTLDESRASSMRLATYKVKADDDAGEAPEVVFFYFGPGQGGDAEQNFLRWSRLVTGADGKPTEPALETINVGALRITVGSFTGRYLAGSPTGPRTQRDNWALVGAVIEGGPQGSVFARLTGPKKAALAQRDVLVAALRSITIANGS